MWSEKKNEVIHGGFQLEAGKIDGNAMRSGAYAVFNFLNKLLSQFM